MAGMSTVRFGAPLANGIPDLQGRRRHRPSRAQSLYGFAHCLSERLQVAMHGVRLQEDFSRRRPNHYQAITFILTLELGDLRLTVWPAPACFCLALHLFRSGVSHKSGQNGLHGLIFLKRLFSFSKDPFEYAGVHGRVVGRIRKMSQAPKTRFLKIGQRHKVPMAGHDCRSSYRDEWSPFGSSFQLGQPNLL